MNVTGNGCSAMWRGGLGSRRPRILRRSRLCERFAVGLAAAAIMGALPWLLGVANNVIADHRRLETRRLKMIAELVRETPGIVEHVDSALAPELADALRRLPVDERDALLLVVWGELSYEEAATALDIRTGTLGSRVFRARKRLSESLEPRWSRFARSHIEDHADA
jgi:DNA-directed RNA polymerase specialized sigma24 family protein